MTATRIAVELVVTLKIPDVTALTARHALQQQLGYGDVLADLRRADWWRLSLAVDSAELALGLARELAEATPLFVNPNKHTYTLDTRPPLPKPLPGTMVIGVLTGFHDDATADLTAQALRGRLGYGDRVAAVEHGTLWTLFLREPDAAKARVLAERITVSRRRGEGLLANPHSQWWRLVDG